MNDLIDTIDLPSGRIVEIVYDGYCYDPLKEFDRLETIITTDNRYFTGDEIIDDDWEEKRKEIEDEGGIVLPLYMLAHSIIHLSLDPFVDRWDSGCVGFVYVTREKLDDEYKGYTLEMAQECAQKCIEGDIKLINAYLEGNVYGIRMIDENNQEMDAIYGVIDDIDEIPKFVGEYFELLEEDEQFLKNL